jgi:hypothetical protein
MCFVGASHAHGDALSNASLDRLRFESLVAA